MSIFKTLWQRFVNHKEPSGQKSQPEKSQFPYQARFVYDANSQSYGIVAELKEDNKCPYEDYRPDLNGKIMTVIDYDDYSANMIATCEGKRYSIFYLDLERLGK